MIAASHGPDAPAGVDAIVDDNRKGAAIAVEYLASLGHQRITHVAGGEASGGLDRAAGYQETMQRLGLADWVQVVPGEFTQEAGYEAGRHLLAADTLPTAVFACNDAAAVGVLTALDEAGVSVPDEMSVLGYDTRTWPPCRASPSPASTSPALRSARWR